RGGCSYSSPGFRLYICVGAPPPVRAGLSATPPPQANIRTRGGCSYSGFGVLRYVLRRSTALGAKGPNAPTPKSQTQKNRLIAGFSVSAERNQAAVARALMCAFRRLLWRAALFLAMMPLSAMRSMTGTAAV